MSEARQDDARRRVSRVEVAVPELPARLVSRPRLVSLLDQAADTTVMLVCAPAGSGKTLMLAEWVRRSGAQDAAWVSLDSADNDDSRFWSAVLQALAACPIVPRDSPLRTMAVPARPSADPGFLADVVNALDCLPDSVRLILDDVHELTDPAPLHGLETIMRHQPAGLRLVLSTRQDLPLPLGKLRAADQLTEVRADELEFTIAEAETLLDRAGARLTPDQVRRLVAQTDGWAAGLRLAAVSLSDTKDADRFLADFAENDRVVADYLTDEVLSRLSDELREFLSLISVADEVSAGLAAALSGRRDAGALLDELDRKASLVAPVDRGRKWYRVQALVRSHLLAHLVRQKPDRAAGLRATAADWYAERGEPAHAVDFASRAPDATRVASLLRKHAVELALSGEYQVLGRALAVLGDPAVEADAQLGLVSAWLQLETGEAKIAEASLARVTANWPPRPTAELTALRQLILARRAEVAGDVDHMMRVTQDFDAAPRAQPALNALAMVQRGTAMLSAGDREDAGELLRAALEVARRDGQDYVALQCLTILGGLAAAQGDFPLMDSLAKEVDAENAARGWQRTIEGATACLLLAYGAFLRVDLAECERQTARAAEMVDEGEFPANRSLNLLVGTLGGAVRFDLGDRAAGVHQIRAARLAGGDANFSADQAALCAMLEHRAAVLLGWSDIAREVGSWSEIAIPGSGELLIIKARTQLALGRFDSANHVLRPLLDGAVAAVLPWSIIEAWVLRTVVALREGHEPRARKALERALSIAEPLGVLYPLVCAAPEVIHLLTQRLGKLGPFEQFAGDVVARRRSLPARQLPVPLTDSERRVLALLPTMRSFEQIAEDLTISPNTVKTHARAIYGKLGVRKRRDAVTVALELGLLGAFEGTTAAR